MKSFNSFNQIQKDTPSIALYLQDHHKYWAHTSKSEQVQPEKLIEHIEKVNEYALKLIEANRLDQVVDSLIGDCVSDVCIEHDLVGNYIKTLFFRSIVFHDYGKVNPNFQAKKMSNPLFSWDNEIKIDSQHSRLSAFLYIHYHLKELESLENADVKSQIFILLFVFVFSNPILKHHSSFIAHDVSFEKTIFDSLKPFLSIFKAELKDSWEFFQNFDNKTPNSYISYFQEIYSTKSYFPLFVLIKLNFSLLTAADYYATNDYCSGMVVDDFGLMNKDLKARIIANFGQKPYFANNKTNYNFDLYQNYAYYKNIHPQDLQERSNANMNLLRQKMATEVIENIRIHHQNNLFYLEAPTGGGKTNLSMAVISELLQMDSSLDKVFYVFPFNTLISQTFDTLKNSFGLTNNDIVQLHSKSGFHEKEVSEEKDALYGKDKWNFIDNLFINYPFTLLSHIKFFDILKNNGKEINYVLHRLTNAVVVIDELQSYNPKHWDKVIFFLSNYAKHFNLKIVLMSATLPKIDELEESAKGCITPLVNNKNAYFTNPNFKGRVTFDFSLLDLLPKDNNNLAVLVDFLYKESEAWGSRNNNASSVIIEFIKKKTAGLFFKLLQQDPRFEDYSLYLISGEILEPRRKEIIDTIKQKKEESTKVILVSTQVIEAGVDIDMDLGFKDKSLIDSDEQLAGRVNRNASKTGSVVYIFDLDNKFAIYGKDERYKITKEQIENSEYKEILETKNFDKLYEKVTRKINQKNRNEYMNETLNAYKEYFKCFNFREVHQKFQLIEEKNVSIFVPLPIPITSFSEEDKQVLRFFDLLDDETSHIQGAAIWQKYMQLIKASYEMKHAYFENQTQLKKISGILSKFIFSVYEKAAEKLREFCYAFDSPVGSSFDQYGVYYMHLWDRVYTYEGGINSEQTDLDNFL